jgi:hypothetical protein
MRTTHNRTKFVTAAFAAIAGAAILTGCQSPFSSAKPDFEALESYLIDELNDDYSAISRQVSSVECPLQADTVKSGGLVAVHSRSRGLCRARAGGGQGRGPRVQNT